MIYVSIDLFLFSVFSSTTEIYDTDLIFMKLGERICSNIQESGTDGSLVQMPLFFPNALLVPRALTSASPLFLYQMRRSLALVAMVQLVRMQLQNKAHFNRRGSPARTWYCFRSTDQSMHPSTVRKEKNRQRHIKNVGMNIPYIFHH